MSWSSQGKAGLVNSNQKEQGEGGSLVNTPKVREQRLMGNVVFTLVLAFRAASACAHFFSESVNFLFPRVHLVLRDASQITENLRSLGASATVQGSLGLAEGRRESTVLRLRRVCGCVGTPRRDLWHLSPARAGGGSLSLEEGRPGQDTSLSGRGRLRVGTRGRKSWEFAACVRDLRWLLQRARAAAGGARF